MLSPSRAVGATATVRASAAIRGSDTLIPSDSSSVVTLMPAATLHRSGTSVQRHGEHGVPAALQHAVSNGRQDHSRDEMLAGRTHPEPSRTGVWLLPSGGRGRPCKAYDPSD